MTSPRRIHHNQTIPRVDIGWIWRLEYAGINIISPTHPVLWAARSFVELILTLYSILVNHLSGSLGTCSISGACIHAGADGISARKSHHRDSTQRSYIGSVDPCWILRYRSASPGPILGCLLSCVAPCPGTSMCLTHSRDIYRHSYVILSLRMAQPIGKSIFFHDNVLESCVRDYVPPFHWRSRLY